MPANKKYRRFRKMYFVCADKQVIGPNVHMTNAYQFKNTADAVCKQSQRTGTLAWEKNIPVPILTVEEFYLVPACLYDEILKPYCHE